jgi:hypothetical protein
MKFKFLIFVPIIISLLPGFSLADEDLTHFKKTLERTISSSYQGWSFTATTNEDGVTLVEKIDFTKSNGERWILVSKNGQKVSAREAEKHSKMKQKEDETALLNHESPVWLLNNFLKTMIKPGSVKFKEIIKGNNLYNFQPQIGEDDEDFDRNLSGEIFIKSDDTVLTKLRIFNKTNFSTSGVKIVEFNHVMKFAETDSGDGQTKPVFLQSSASRVKGKVMGFTVIDNNQTVIFENYQKKEQVKE